MDTAGKTATARRFDATALRGAVVHVLLDLTYAGRLFRLARTELLVTSTATGEQLQYAGDLVDEVRWEEVVNLFQSSADSVSAPLAFTLPVDVAALVQRGQDLLQATGELSLWIEGTAYEARRVLLRGQLVDPSYGYAGEPVVASLESEAFRDRAVVPPALLVVSTEAWPNASSSALGLSYPLPFGESSVASSPAYLVDDTPANEVLLVAAGSTVADSASVSDGTTVEVRALTQTTDALGRVCTTMAMAGTALALGGSFGVAWNQGAGGMQARDGGTLTRAGDVLEAFLAMSTLPVDWGRVAAAKPYLDPFLLCGCVVEGVTPWEWITSNVLPLLPCSLVNGPDGVYPLPWRYAATRRDAVATIDTAADPDVELDGAVLVDGSARSLTNRLKLRYALDQLTGTTTRYAVLGSDDGTSAAVAESVYCAQSRLRYGVLEVEAESTVVYDPATAAMVLAWQARAKALPTRRVQYLMPSSWGWLERGDVVLLTDAGLSFNLQPALVEGTTYQEDGMLRLQLRLVDDAARSFHVSG